MRLAADHARGRARLARPARRSARRRREVADAVASADRREQPKRPRSGRRRSPANAGRCTGRARRFSRRGARCRPRRTRSAICRHPTASRRCASSRRLRGATAGPTSSAADTASPPRSARGATSASTARRRRRAGAPRERIAAIERLALAVRRARRAWTTTSCTTRARHLLAIGYNVAERRRDASYYDLLASEARLCSFVAIAQGQLPQESWFALGRLLTTAGGEPVLAVVERLDVRVPDAAAGDADVRKHAARPDLPGGGGAADRVRQAARRAVGHLGIRLQHGRCAASTTSTARSACPAWD